MRGEGNQEQTVSLAEVRQRSKPGWGRGETAEGAVPSWASVPISNCGRRGHGGNAG